MIRAMYSGISGLKANQARLDVVGNNIANVNTTAFKVQRMKFQDTISQNITSASGPNSSIGGTNAKQVGLGVQIAGIDTLVSQGSMQPTSRNLDFAVDGEGYFVVGKGGNNSALTVKTPVDGDAESNTITGGTMSTNFTRDGSFILDYDGNLLTSDGLRVMGYALTTDGTTSSIAHDPANPSKAATCNYVDAESTTIKAMADSTTTDSYSMVPLSIPDYVTDTADSKQYKIKSFSVDSNGMIKAVLDNNKMSVLGQIAMVSFKNPEGLSKEGKNLYGITPNSGVPVFRTSYGETIAPNDSTYGSIRQGMLEMSNVDLAEQFTDMIVASRAFQANGKIITTSDEILQELVNLKR